MAHTSDGTKLPRRVSLLVALTGGVLTATLPFCFTPVEPLPLILLGSGVTAAALECFLFFSI
jgi:hypothetical protein